MDEMNRQTIIRRQKRYQNFLKSMNCCPLCSAPLTLIHEVDSDSGSVKETAHCEDCDVETRRKEHPLQ